MNSSRRTVAVTGANGFIGSELVARLEGNGHTVVVFGDERDLDIQDTVVVRRALENARPSVIYHLAAVSGPMLLPDHPEIVTAVNTVGTINVLEAVRSIGCRVVLASSVAGFSTGPMDDPCPSSVYGVTKRFVELAGRVYRAQFGVDATSARIGSVFGIERKTDHVLHRMIEEALHEGAISYEADRWEPLVHVSDCARLLAELAEVDDWRDVYDVVTTPRTHEQLARSVRDALPGRRIRLRELPRTTPTWGRAFDAEGLSADTASTSLEDVDAAVARLVESRAGVVSGAAHVSDVSRASDAQGR